MAPDDTVRGRLLLMFSGYAPVMIIVALRGWPHWGAKAALGIGVLGIAAGLFFLVALARDAQRLDLRLDSVEALDKDVAAFIASYLLPVVAVTQVNTRDAVAYGLCAVLFGLVAFRARLWAINPLVYAVGRQVSSAVVGTRRVIVLSRGPLVAETEIIGSELLGVVWVRRTV